MIRFVVAAALISGACNAGAPAPAQAPAGARAPGPGPLVDAISVIGAWSFDRSCASEDGMTLKPDGTAANGLGVGWWAVDTHDRLVLIIREREPASTEDPLAERRVYLFTPSETVGDDMKGRLEGPYPGQAPKTINARRCPEQ